MKKIFFRLLSPTLYTRELQFLQRGGRNKSVPNYEQFRTGIKEPWQNESPIFFLFNNDK